MSKQDWIVVFNDLPNQRFLAHPRGAKTMLRQSAHGWHYKKDAKEFADQYKDSTVTVERRGDCK